MRSRIVPIMHKEFIHILRDPRSLAIIFFMPVMMILIYGYAITYDIRDIKLGILDYDQSQDSRQLVAGLTSSNYFKVTARPQDRQGVEELMLQRRILAALVIPAGFSRELGAESHAQVQLLVDGSNANTATVAINYLKSFILTYTLSLNVQTLQPPIMLHPRVWYNPDMKSTHFIVPGLVAIIMMMICALLTSVTIARERETGTMEQILVSPIRSIEIIIGKILPYVLLALIDAALIVLFARVVFGVPFRGSAPWLLLFAIVYIYASLSIGVFISARTKTQQVALMVALAGTLLPSVLLSGFVFPIASMPIVLQGISYIVPAKYFLVLIRGIMLKGVGTDVLYPQVLFLLTFGTILLAISVKRFKTNLEG